MAAPSAVNSQITDAITQANTKVLGDMPAMAAGELYQNAIRNLNLTLQNTVSNQQQPNEADLASPEAAKPDAEELEALIRQLKSE
ncbi:RebB family R body protein [Chromobacterium alticapitis]|uniref:R body protein RebB-like protein n=1 Tax=Chromobacterium alticapitis TaxID=2073169 RepID=A0A2S5DHA4_9NEIS|nr:RebB family R body protein [Chromobacterium alticapitis]POZ62466.1 R body protein RebB-like protein [Chromobacterium alticapitis]